MALKLADRTKEVSNTTGAGPFHMNGAVADFQAMSAALADGDTAYFAATDGVATWVVFLGTYAAAANTVAVTTVLASSPGYAGFANAPTIWIDAPAALLSKLLSVMPTNDNLVGVNLTQTLANKTLTNPYVNNTLVVGDDPTYATQPSTVLGLSRAQNSGTVIRLRNNNAGTAAFASINIENGTHQLQMGITSTGYTPVGPIHQDNAFISDGNAASGLTLISQAGAINFAAGNVICAAFTLQGRLIIGSDGIGYTDYGGPFSAVQSQNGNAYLTINNPNGGVSARSGMLFSNNVDYGQLLIFGQGQSTGLMYYPGAVYLTATKGIAIIGNGNYPVHFGVNGVRQGFFDANPGYTFHALGNYAGGGIPSCHSMDTTNPNDWMMQFLHHDGTTASPNGVILGYYASPNVQGQDFIVSYVGYGTTYTGRFVAYSNGGLGNFSANNVNFSDIRAKPVYERHADNPTLGAQLWDAFQKVDWGRFKFEDQTHDDFNYGYSAQGVQAAFKDVVPEIVTDWNDHHRALIEQRIKEIGGTMPPDRLGVYSGDLEGIAFGVLAMAQARIEALEAKIQKLETRH